MILNNATCLNHRNQFLKDFKIIFSYSTNSAPVLLQSCVKRLAFNSSAIMCYVMKTKNIKTIEYIKNK